MHTSIAQVNLNLPSSEGFYQQAFGLAWPQVLAFTTACVSILVVVLIIKSFVARG